MWKIKFVVTTKFEVELTLQYYQMRIQTCPSPRSVFDLYSQILYPTPYGCFFQVEVHISCTRTSTHRPLAIQRLIWFSFELVIRWVASLYIESAGVFPRKIFKPSLFPNHFLRRNLQHQQLKPTFPVNRPCASVVWSSIQNKNFSRTIRKKNKRNNLKKKSMT